MRMRGKLDANHAQLRHYFRAHGIQWCDTSHVGKGFPDALAKFGQKLVLIEIKDGSKPPSAQKLTTDQRVFHSEWDVRIVRDETDAKELINWLRSP